MKNNKIGMIGNFMYDYREVSYNGQAIKTDNIYAALATRYGEDNIYTVDAYRMKDNILERTINIIKILMFCEIIIILPTKAVLNLLAPILSLFRLLKKTKIVYSVVGGWLPEELKGNTLLLKQIRNWDKVYVETKSMKSILKELKVENVEYMPNISARKQLNFNILESLVFSNPKKVCIFSRITETKGIGEAIEAVVNVNDNYKNHIYELDIYGQIDPEYEDEFSKLLNQYQEYITYKGVLKGDNVTEILSQYYLLLFPTFYPGEGLAGTILDAYNAGLPIIATDWKYNNEIIIENVTGFLYEVHNIKKLEKILEDLFYKEDCVLNMHKMCLKESRKYSTSVVLNPLYEFIDKIF